MTASTFHDWPIHPVAELFPLMQGQLFEDFVDDIRQNGLQVPITLDPEGRVIDGRNRLRACWAAGIDPMTDVYDGDNVLQFVISHNLHRRHLSDSQRAMIAARLATRPEGVQDHRADISTMGPNRHAVADLLHVGQDSISKAKRVIRDGSTDLAELVTAGSVAVNTAARVSELPAAEQEDFVSKVKEGASPIAVAPPTRRLQVVVDPRPPAPPKYGGNRRKHLQMIEHMINGLTAYGVLVKEIEASGLDTSVTAEEAARLRGGLSEQVRLLNRISNLLLQRERTA